MWWLSQLPSVISLHLQEELRACDPWSKPSPFLHLYGTAGGMKAWQQLKYVISSNNASENIFLRFLFCFCHKKQDWKTVCELFKINPFVPFLQMQVIAERFGISLNQILPIKKYISGLDLTCSVDILFFYSEADDMLSRQLLWQLPFWGAEEKCWKFPVAFDILCACWPNLYKILALEGVTFSATTSRFNSRDISRIASHCSFEAGPPFDEICCLPYAWREDSCPLLQNWYQSSVLYKAEGSFQNCDFFLLGESPVQTCQKIMYI